MNAQRFSVGGLFQRRMGALVVGAVFAACSGSGTEKQAAPAEVSSPLGAAGSPASANDPLVAEWRKAIAKVPSPKDGCFQASYPSTTWTEVPCAPAPVDAVPSHGPPGPSTASKGPEAEASPFVGGGGGDYYAQMSGPIYEAIGSFPSVSGVTGSNGYSIQLNSNAFTIPATNSICPKCRGWQQAVYSVSQGTFIEYWLLGQGANCPSGWTSQNGGCFKNTSAVSGVPSDPISDLSTVKMEMIAGSNDSLTMTIGGQAYTGSWGSTLGLNQNLWTSAEFGIYGDAGGSNVNITGNATIVAQIAAYLPNITTCTTNSFGGATGETNNLNAICCLANGGGPDTITFQESTTAGQSCSLCGAEGQSCCTLGGTNGTVSSWCSSPFDACSGGVCQACGYNGDPCCGGSACFNGAQCISGSCCTPLTACQSYQCGTMSNGCGGTITCPVTCGTNQYCDSSTNTCQDVPLCNPACPNGYICEAPNGPPGVCVVNHRCPPGFKYCNGKCIAQSSFCP